jgi:trk system potassium uptake protein TrkH
VRRPRIRVGPRLHWALIVPVVGGVLLAMGLGMLACVVPALAGRGGEAAAFGLSGVVAVAAGGLGVVSARRLRSMPLRARDGFAAVTLAWLVAAIAGAVPLLLAGTFDRAVDAVFESMSGFTTTGATLIDDIDGQPDAVLLWRSLMQWIGGVGIVVLVVAIAPATGLATQRIFHAETSSGVTAERLTPRIAETAKIIWTIYLALSALALVAFWAAGMSAWDALNHSFTAVATGGFSTHGASIAHFDSVAVEIVAIVFMLAGGVNFAFYWRALRGGRIWPAAAEVRAYLLIVAGGTAAVTASLVLADGGLWQSLRESTFAVASTMTTTGYTTEDFDLYNDFARAFLLLLMFTGGCAGSTAGGIKVIRVLLLAKASAQEVQRQLRPTAVQVLRTRGRVFSEEVRRGVLGFAVTYLGVSVVGLMAMLASGLDLVSAASSVAATINVVGPGVGQVGALDNYTAVSEGGRVVLSALMLIGRLEVFTVLVLFTPAFWRPSVA